jgi:MFS family permease
MDDGRKTASDEDDYSPDALARFQLNDAITQIGPGPYQLVVLCLAGGVYMAEGSLLLMLSVIAKNLIRRWRLSALFAGAMVSIIFCGLLIGTIFGGFLCDRYGRRMPILVTYSGITVFLVASLMSPDVLLLITAKFMLGISLGFGVPAANAMVCECCPASHRSNVYSMTMVLFSLGQMYSAMVIWTMSPDLNHDELHWRGMLALAALMPLILSVLSYFFLLESPHWLLAQRRYSAAKAVVMEMASYKGCRPEQVEELTSCIHSAYNSPEARQIEPEFDPKEEDRSCCSLDQRKECWLVTSKVWSGVKEDFGRLENLFSEKFFKTTMFMSYISFVSNFAYYGMIYGLPDTLKKEQPQDKEGLWSPAAGVFFSAVFEIPGVFIAILLGTTVGRKMNMTISFWCTALALAAVVRVLIKGDMEGFGLIAVFCVKLFIASVFIVVYLYLLECYPTKFRATGLAFCMVIGRMGAFACPFLYDGLVIFGIHHMYFFIIMGVLVTVAGIVSLLLPYETKDAQLMDDDVPVEEVAMTPRGSLKSPEMRYGAMGNMDSTRSRRSSLASRQPSQEASASA